MYIIQPEKLLLKFDNRTAGIDNMNTPKHSSVHINSKANSIQA